MAIRVDCHACHKTHQVPDDIAGRRVRCDCGATFRVPRLAAKKAMPVGQRRRLLAEATLSEVLEELSRRGYHGVFAQIDVHEFDVANLADLVDAREPLTHGIECHLTETLDDEHREALLKSLAEGIERIADPAAADHADSYYEPFALKGDALGMPLDEFKQKHRREVPGQAHSAPFSSDMGGGFTIGALHTEPWHAAAGIVHARQDFPSEDRSPVIAGVATDLVLYQFLDGGLYQIIAQFGTESFPAMANSLRQKYGSEMDESFDSGRLTWRRLHSTLELIKGRISPRAPATLRLYIDEALAEAESRRQEHLRAI